MKPLCAAPYNAAPITSIRLISTSSREMDREEARLGVWTTKALRSIPVCSLRPSNGEYRENNVPVQYDSQLNPRSILKPATSLTRIRVNVENSGVFHEPGRARSRRRTSTARHGEHRRRGQD